MNNSLKKIAEEINTEWCYFLDVDGDDSDVFIHFFKRMNWFTKSEKVPCISDDILNYKIIIPFHDLKSNDWKELFFNGCLISSLTVNEVDLILKDHGFISIAAVKPVTEEQEKILVM